MFAKRSVTLLTLLAVAALILVACAPGTTTGSDADREEDGHAEEAASGHDVAEAAESHEQAEVAADHHDEEEHGSAREVLDDAKEIRIVADEFAFEPASLHLHEGEAVNIVLVNEGVVEHEIELEAFGFHLHVEPGETVTAGFVADQAGTFEFGCFVPGHFDAGMAGELVVEAAHS